MHCLLKSLNIERVGVVGTSMGGLMTFALNALYPGLISRAVINDIGPEIATAGLERIKSYVGSAGPFDNWDSATAYIKSMTAEIFPLWDEEQWAYFARQSYVDRKGKIVIDYDPRIVEPLKEEGADTESDTLWEMFDALETVPILLVRATALIFFLKIVWRRCASDTISAPCSRCPMLATRRCLTSAV